MTAGLLTVKEQDPELVSIVIPVHNAESYIGTCLEHVLGQTHDRLQVLLVDDGSTDKSVQIVDDAAARDGRVTAIHQQNAGPAAARNAGLDQVEGAWVMFVDADDEIETDYVEQMLALAREDRADIVVSDCMIEEDGVRSRFGMIVPNCCYEGAAEVYADFMRDHIPWSLWGKLYRTVLFSDLRFSEENYIAEDLEANARLFAKKGIVVSTTDGAGYCYHVVAGSIDHSFDERYLRQFSVFDDVTSRAVEAGLVAPDLAAVFYERRVLNCFGKAVKADALDKRVSRAFADAIASYRADAIACPEAPDWLVRQLRVSRFGMSALAALYRARG